VQYSQLCSAAAAASRGSDTSDEFLYGRAGTLFGALLLNQQLGQQGVPAGVVQHLVDAILASGENFLTGQFQFQADVVVYQGAGRPWWYSKKGSHATTFGDMQWPKHLCLLPPDRPLATPPPPAGRQLAAHYPGCPTPLMYVWGPADPYLGAAHGLMGILYVLLHCRPQLDQAPGAWQDVQGALQ
jgi:hypothetical protein